MSIVSTVTEQTWAHDFAQRSVTQGSNSRDHCGPAVLRLSLTRSPCGRLGQRILPFLFDRFVFYSGAKSYSADTAKTAGLLLL